MSCHINAHSKGFKEKQTIFIVYESANEFSQYEYKMNSQLEYHDDKTNKTMIINKLLDTITD